MKGETHKCAKYNRDQLVETWCDFRCNWLKNETGMSHNKSHEYFGDVYCGECGDGDRCKPHFDKVAQPREKTQKAKD